jgi:predicted nucleotidyltransferase
MRQASKIRKVIQALLPYDPEQIYLFGSWAREEQDELSDLDLVIIKKTTKPFFDRLREVYDLIPQTAGPVDALVYTPEEFAQMQKDGNLLAEIIVDEGRLVYERRKKS